MKKSTSIIILIALAGLITTGVILKHRSNNQTAATNSLLLPNTTTGKLAGQLEEQHKKYPTNTSISINLARAYLQLVRETADVAYYNKIDELMAMAEKNDPTNADIYATRSAVASGRHHFKEGLANAQKAVALNPEQALYYGLVADAQIELGQYEESVDTIQHMVDLKPNLSSYNRVAYIRELYGDIDGAKESLEEAINASSNFLENVAFSYVELGKLQTRDDVAAAQQSFTRALDFVPNYPPALEGLGKLAFFSGDTDKALDYFKQAFDILPIAQYATLIGDVYTTQGDTTKASQQYLLAKIAYEKSQASGVNTDLEFAFFLADHFMDIDTAVAKAEVAYKERPSTLGADTLAWAYYQKAFQLLTSSMMPEHPDETDYLQLAQNHINEALQLGEHEPLFLYHAGMIAGARNDTVTAKRYLQKALELNPRFSILHAKRAQDFLKSL